MTDRAAVQSVLTRYREALSEFDVIGTVEIWPTVDQSRLERSFNQMAEQSFQFDRCDMTLSAAKASATCTGTVRYVPEVGSRRPRVESRQWQFNLSKVDQRWVIDTVSSR